MAIGCVNCLIIQFVVQLQAWTVVKKSHTKLRLRMGAAEAELRTAPAALEVSLGGLPVLVWNGGQQFVFEHLRQQQEGDPEGWWAENFKSHHDSKPKGPTAISFDVQVGAARVRPRRSSRYPLVVESLRWAGRAGPGCAGAVRVCQRWRRGLVHGRALHAPMAPQSNAAQPPFTHTHMRPHTPP